jgi:hypothetical protein
MASLLCIAKRLVHSLRFEFTLSNLIVTSVGTKNGFDDFEIGQ